MPQMKCANPDCYARVLGECSTEISREHYMPHSMLKIVDPEGVWTRNFRGRSTDGWKKLPPTTLESWILCQVHNNNYQHLDKAGETVLRALDRINATAENGGGEPEVFSASGDDFERCMLKIMMGGVYCGVYPTHKVSQKKILPPEEWVRIAFKNQTFRQGQGLYIFAGPDEYQFQTTPDMLRVMVMPNVDTGQTIGFWMSLVNIQFMLYLGNDPADCASLEHTLYRPAGIVIQGSNKRIEFSWAQPGVSQHVAFRYDGPGQLPPDHNYPGDE